MKNNNDLNAIQSALYLLVFTPILLGVCIVGFIMDGSIFFLLIGCKLIGCIIWSYYSYKWIKSNITLNNNRDGSKRIKNR